MKSKKYRKPRKKNKTMRGGGLFDSLLGTQKDCELSALEESVRGTDNRENLSRRNHERMFAYSGEAMSLFEPMSYSYINAGANTIGDVIEMMLTNVYGKLFDEETHTENDQSPNSSTENEDSFREKTKTIMNQIIAESCEEVNFGAHKILTKKQPDTIQNVDNVGKHNKNNEENNENVATIKDTKFCKTYEDTKKEAQKNKQTAKSIFSLLKKKLNSQNGVEDFLMFFVSPEFLEGVMDSHEMHEKIDTILNEINWDVLRKESTHEKMTQIIGNTAAANENGFELKKITFVEEETTNNEEPSNNDTPKNAIDVANTYNESMLSKLGKTMGNMVAPRKKSLDNLSVYQKTPTTSEKIMDGAVYAASLLSGGKQRPLRTK
jgi:hypothetical protein